MQCSSVCSKLSFHLLNRAILVFKEDYLTKRNNQIQHWKKKQKRKRNNPTQQRRKYIHKSGGVEVIEKEGSGGRTKCKQRWEDVAQTVAVSNAPLLRRHEQGGELGLSSLFLDMGNIKILKNHSLLHWFSIQVWQEWELVDSTHYFSVLILSLYISSHN